MTRRHLASVSASHVGCASREAARRNESAREETRSARRDELARGGWTLRNLCDAARLDETRALYLSLGLEVLLDAPSEEDFDAACVECVASCPAQRFVYTRPVGGGR